MTVFHAVDMAPIEIIDYDRLPEDFSRRWESGRGPFWMVQVGDEGGGFTRWSGVCLAHRWDTCHIDICPPQRYAYINARGYGQNPSQKLPIAREFVKAYGGKMYRDGEPIE